MLLDPFEAVLLIVFSDRVLIRQGASQCPL